MNFHVRVQRALCGEVFRTQRALMGLFLCVCPITSAHGEEGEEGHDGREERRERPHVELHGVGTGKTLLTHVTRVRSFLRVRSLVILQMMLSGECFRTV